MQDREGANMLLRRIQSGLPMQRDMDKRVPSEGQATVQDTPLEGVSAMNRGIIPIWLLVVAWMLAVAVIEGVRK